MDVHIVEASNGQEAVDQARRTNPDVIILDLAMPIMTSLEAAGRRKEEMPQVPLLITSMHDDGHAMTRELAKIEVHGFVTKTDAAQKFPDAIETVLAGGTCLGRMPT